jgi:hypothetical protein
MTSHKLQTGEFQAPWQNTGLSKIAAVMCIVVAVGGALAELALLWVWLSPGSVEAFVVPHLGLGTTPVALGSGQRVAGFLISMIPLSVLFYALHQAYELFDGYRCGDVFSAKAPVRLRRIGFAMLALAPLRPLTNAALGALLTSLNPPGQKLLVLGLSIDDYMIALFGGLILAIGHVLVEANRLADDHRQII